LLEGQERLVGLPGALADVHRISKIEPLPPLEPNDESLGEVTCVDFDRVDPKNLSAMSLYVLASNARSSGCMSSCQKFAQALVEQGTASTGDASAASVDARMIVEGYILWMMATAEPSESVAIGDRAIEYCRQHNQPFASILLAKLELCLSMADQDGFRQSLADIEANYGNDPGVMARVQQLLVQLGIIRPDGSLRQAPGPSPAGDGGADFAPAPPPAERGEGLWTPDQGSPTKPASGGEGGGKLWIPGMD